jgi:hypothetical protein
VEYLGPILTGTAAVVAILYNALRGVAKERRTRIEAQRRAEMDNLRLEIENEALKAEVARLKAAHDRRDNDRRR